MRPAKCTRGDCRARASLLLLLHAICVRAAYRFAEDSGA
jgi:hypothetical protein